MLVPLPKTLILIHLTAQSRFLSCKTCALEILDLYALILDRLLILFIGLYILTQSKNKTNVTQHWPEEGFKGAYSPLSSSTFHQLRASRPFIRASTRGGSCIRSEGKFFYCAGLQLIFVTSATWEKSYSRYSLLAHSAELSGSKRMNQA